MARDGEASYLSSAALPGSFKEMVLNLKESIPLLTASSLQQWAAASISSGARGSRGWKQPAGTEETRGGRRQKDSNAQLIEVCRFKVEEEFKLTRLQCLVGRLVKSGLTC